MLACGRSDNGQQYRRYDGYDDADGRAEGEGGLEREEGRGRVG